MSERDQIIKKMFRAEMVRQIKEEESLRKRANAHRLIVTTMCKIAGGKKPEQWMTRTIKRSKMQEKLCRYAHNLNIEKVEKYDKILHEFDMEQMDDCRENPGNFIVFEEHTKRTKTNEGGYLSVCDEAKYQFEERAKIIKLVKKIKMGINYTE